MHISQCQCFFLNNALFMSIIFFFVIVDYIVVVVGVVIFVLELMLFEPFTFVRYPYCQ